MIRKKLSALALVFTLLSCCMFSLPVSAAENSAVGGSSPLRLSIDEETCTVSVENTQTGELWSTNPIDPQEDKYTVSATLNDIRSQLIVSYYDSENKKAVIGSYLSSVKRGSYKIKQSDNIIRVDYDFSRPNEQFSIPIEYRLENGCLSVSVLVDEIDEYGEVKIGEISVLPYFLRGTVSDSGYILIPDGSGALMDLSTLNSSASAYKQRIYGRDPALSYYYDQGNELSAMLPVFGMYKNGSAVLAVVSGNESAASVCAECSGITSSYSRVYSSFVYRVFDTVTISGSDWRYKEYTVAAESTEQTDFSVEYYFIGDGGYTDMALKYREHLEKEGVLSEALADSQVLSGALKAYGCTEIKDTFLGIPYTKTIAATTFSDVSDMLADIQQDGEKQLAVFLESFDKDALSGDYPSGNAWLGKTGGSSAYAKMLDSFGENCRFFKTADVLYEECGGLIWFNQHKYSQMVSKDYITAGNYSSVTYEREDSDWYALTVKQLNKRTDKLFSKTSKMKNPVGLALDYLGNTLYADYNEKSFVSRDKMQENFRDIIKSATQSTDTCIQGGNAYAMGLCDTYYDYPMTSSELIISSKTVPFAQIVLHGYANMVSSPLNIETDSLEKFLNCMEYGMTPCFAVTGVSNTELRRTGYKDLYGTCYSDIADELKSKLSRSADLFDSVGTSRISEHSSGGGLGVTVYENGITVVVNYTDGDLEYNGHTVPSEDFMVL